MRDVGRAHTTDFTSFNMSRLVQARYLAERVSCAMKLIFMFSLKFVIACCPCCAHTKSKKVKPQSGKSVRKLLTCSFSPFHELILQAMSSCFDNVEKLCVFVPFSCALHYSSLGFASSSSTSLWLTTCRLSAC